jgi:hypothetical protein
MVVCVAFAYVNARTIKSEGRIYHGVNGLLHLTVWFVFYDLFETALVISYPFIARLFFDLPLNLFRGLDSGYVPENPKSIADKIEIKIFKEDAIAPKVIYFWITLVTIIIQSGL